jgi:hypothetical protein
LGLLALPVAADPPKKAPPQPAPAVGPAALAPAFPAEFSGELDKIKVGSWVEYLVADLGRKTTLRLRLAIVERSEAGTWMELTLQAPAMERLVVKTLVKGDQRSPASARRVILKAGNMQPVEVVGGEPAPAAPRWQPAPTDVARRIGSESVRVPAGVLSAEHFRTVTKRGTTDTWLSGKIPLFGLVKVKSPEYIYELAASGFDARTAISGRVGKIDLAALAGMGQPSSQPAP